MDEDWRSDGIAHEAIDDLDRVLRLSDVDEPCGGAAWSGQFEPGIVQPDHEDLGLDWALDVDSLG